MHRTRKASDSEYLNRCWLIGGLQLIRADDAICQIRSTEVSHKLFRVRSVNLTSGLVFLDLQHCIVFISIPYTQLGR